MNALNRHFSLSRFNIPLALISLSGRLFTGLWATSLLAGAFVTSTHAGTAGDFDYVLTTRADTVRPGHVVEFDVTVRNLTNASKNVVLFFDVPQFTTSLDTGGDPPGTRTDINFGSVAAQTSKSAILRFLITGGNQAPPDGTVIPLTLEDQDRAQMVSGSVEVQATPVLNLQLSTENGTVAPGETFTYTLIASNISSSSVGNVQLSADIPSGATLIDAGGGGVNGGTVTWPLGTLPAGANVQRHIMLQASGITNTPLGPLKATLSDGVHTARASDTRAVYQTPQLDYIVTAPVDPIRPGHVAEFDVTVRNLSGTNQNVVLWFVVPDFSTSLDTGSDTEGVRTDINFGSVALGASKTAKVRFAIPGGNQSPPEGTTINLALMDFDRGASISRSVIIRNASPLNLRLSHVTPGTVAPGGTFTYSLTASNTGTTTAAAVQLSVPIPAGATFVSSDGGVVTNGVVNWSLGALLSGATRRLNLTLQASASSNVPLHAVDATLTDSAGHVARASDTRAVYAAPNFEYTVSSSTDPAVPGQNAVFTVVVHNLSGSNQNLVMWFVVPDYTTSLDTGSDTEGVRTDINFGSVASGASKSATLRFAIAGGNTSPPNGTLITLNLADFDRGGSVSRTVIVRSPAAAKADFNADTRPDWVIQNPSSRQTRIWLMNNGVLSSSLAGPTLPVHWTLVDADQFNAANSSDLLLFNAMTRQTAVWYLSGATFLSGRSGPTLPSGYTLVLSQDFNGDNRPDFLLYNPSTRRTAIWYLNSLVQHIGGGFGPTLPAGYVVLGSADFNQDGTPDLLLWNAFRRTTAIWYLNGLALASSAYGPSLPSGWILSAADDFNRDGYPDLALASPSAHQTAIWYLNNNVRFSSKLGPNTPAGFYLTAPR